jgi:transposase
MIKSGLLMTLPGVGPAGAQALYAALGDWKRLKMELTRQGPSTRQSANHCHHGFITKAGNSLARWLLTQATRRAESCGIEYKGVEAWLEQLAQELRNKT